jgi:hypothetical protein
LEECTYKGLCIKPDYWGGGGQAPPSEGLGGGASGPPGSYSTALILLSPLDMQELL